MKLINRNRLSWQIHSHWKTATKEIQFITERLYAKLLFPQKTEVVLRRTDPGFYDIVFDDCINESGDFEQYIIRVSPYFGWIHLRKLTQTEVHTYTTLGYNHDCVKRFFDMLDKHLNLIKDFTVHEQEWFHENYLDMHGKRKA